VPIAVNSRNRREVIDVQSQSCTLVVNPQPLSCRSSHEPLPLLTKKDLGLAAGVGVLDCVPQWLRDAPMSGPRGGMEVADLPPKLELADRHATDSPATARSVSWLATARRSTKPRGRGVINDTVGVWL
jgi:hypothetical protein